jgi:hypothetical protein
MAEPVCRPGARDNARRAGGPLKPGFGLSGDVHMSQTLPVVNNSDRPVAGQRCAPSTKTALEATPAPLVGAL